MNAYYVSIKYYDYSQSGNYNSQNYNGLLSSMSSCDGSISGKNSNIKIGYFNKEDAENVMKEYSKMLNDEMITACNIYGELIMLRSKQVISISVSNNEFNVTTVEPEPKLINSKNYFKKI